MHVIGPNQKPYPQGHLLHVLSALCALGVFLVFGAGCAVECSKEAPCARGFSCQQGQCKQGITEEKCAVDELGKCRECKRDGECPSQQLCVDGLCHSESKQECTAQTQETDCKGKTKPFCSHAQRCEWGCTQDSHCKPEEECKQHQCTLRDSHRLKCATDADCAGKARIYCSDAQWCEWSCKEGRTYECGRGESCQENVCVRRSNACQSDKDCRSSETCLLDVGLCHPACDGTCAAGQVCVSGACYDSCQTPHTACKGDGYRCIPGSNGAAPYCYPLAAGRERGSLPEGAPCGARPSACNRSQGLYCESSTCVRSCDPRTRLNNPKCQTGSEVCLPSGSPSNSIFGGFCAPVEGQPLKEGKGPCGANKLCEKGLSCLGNRCWRPCDVKDGGSNCKGLDRVCLTVQLDVVFPPRPGAQKHSICAAKPTRKEGDFCYGWPLSGDLCSEGLACKRVCAEGTCRDICIKECDPKVGRDDNPGCSPNQQCIDARCVSRDRKEGENCDFTRGCQKGLACHSHRCRRYCQHSGMCPAGQRCHQNSCLDACDPRKGAVTNPDCKQGYYCLAGRCLGLPGPLQRQKGTKQLGEQCEKYGSSTLFCEATKGLHCATMNRLSQCVKGCDPRRGALQNPACGDALCVESLSTQSGGVCQIHGTLKEGELCTGASNACAKGLICGQRYSGEKIACFRPCDATKPQRTGCSATEVCLQSRCTTLCEPTKGVFANPACPARTFCAKAGSLREYHCVPLPQAQRGTRQLGESCDKRDPDEFCDGSQGLSCSPAGICQRACAPEKGSKTNPACGLGACQYDVSAHNPEVSHLGGYCTLTCDPRQGRFGNSSCPTGYQCKRDGDVTTTCSEPLVAKHQGPRELGESCRLSISSCNGNKDLFCARDQICYKACDPRKGQRNHPDCGPSQECLIDAPDSFKGGRCAAPATQRAGEACDASLTKRCQPGLFCFQGTCHKGCDPSKGVLGNPTCGPAQECLSLLHAPSGGACGPKGTRQQGDSCDPDSLSSRCQQGLFCHQSVCLRACDPTKGTLNNPACPSPQQCSPYSSAPGGGTCNAASTQKEGEACTPFAWLGRACKAGLLCVGQMSSGLPPRCVKACQPSKGVQNNPACNTDETCDGNPQQSGPSFCQPKGTQKQGELCDDIPLSGKRCIPGLACLESLDGQSKPRCGKACQPQLGVVGNPACLADESCDGVQCVKGPVAKQGELCNPYDRRCLDGLACFYDAQLERYTHCAKPCSAALEVTCSAPHVCVKSSDGSLEVCLPKATQGKGESCDDHKSRCGAGLLCASGRCHQACSVTSSCPSGHTCTKGACLPPPHRKTGESCDSATNQCLSGLTCIKGQCRQRCQKHPECNSMYCDGDLCAP